METIHTIQSKLADFKVDKAAHVEDAPTLEIDKTPLQLPPNTDLAKFRQFMIKVFATCGQENAYVVNSKEEHLKDGWYLEQSKTYDMHHLFSERTSFVASAVVCPCDVPQVQAIVRLANEFKIPIWPISIGRNIGYGGAAPRVTGSVVVDMGKNMNKVLNVDLDAASCLLEPGVTYTDLYNYLVEHKLEDKLWIDVPDLGGGSVLGNCLDRGVGYTPYGDHFMMHCGMEIVLPNGELVRTGMGAMPDPTRPGYDPSKPPHEQPGNDSWQLFNYGFGPYLDGIFTQSGLGIVTKLGMWLMPNPGGFEAYMVSFEKESDLEAAIEVIRPLRLQNLLPNVPTMRSIIMDAACLASRKELVSHQGRLTEEDYLKIGKKFDLGRWNFYGAVYGPDAIREVNLKVIKDAFLTIPGARFRLKEDLKEPSILHIRHNTLQGIPTYDELKWLDWIDNGVHLFFAPIARVSGEQAMKQFNISKAIVEEAGLDFIGTFTVGMREMHHIVSILFNSKDDSQRSRALNAIRKLIDICAANGWGEYRTHLALMDQIAGTYNFNNNSLMRLNESIKNAVDPNGIMAPGKSGIWPSCYDKEKWVLN
ncbi:uncharacterized protein V1516DRAFT_683174 [Lipomyces oligophaga]|uniref:uncharacterized protein n=1 Tax=Lipomyces oligophaga TaxID=45792 RepID=UPI0034CF6B52